MIPLLLDYNYSPLIQIEATYVSSWQETGAVAEQKCPLDFFFVTPSRKDEAQTWQVSMCQCMQVIIVYIYIVYTYIYIYTMWETH